ncbi:hypothetical protein HanIR_Chr01g0041001 [Helianthus annuus]|nr:hypothetical protein HanIR_Chr01g0041001 [Helianthus annuus]
MFCRSKSPLDALTLERGTSVQKKKKRHEGRREEARKHGKCLVLSLCYVL